MKKVSIFLVLIMLFGSVTAFAGEDEDEDRRRRRRRRGGPSIEVGINPVGYLVGLYNVIGGLHLSDESSIFLEAAYTYVKSPYISVDTSGSIIDTEVSYSGLAISPEYRYYISPDDGNDKWFFGAYLSFRTTSTSGAPYLGLDEDEEVVYYDISNVSLAPGVTAGYEWRTESGFTFTAWTGLGYSIVYSETLSPNFTPYDGPNLNPYGVVLNVFNKLSVRGGFTVAYRFD